VPRSAERVFFRGEWYEGLYPRAGATPRDLDELRAFEAEMQRWSRWRDGQGRRAFDLPRARGSDADEVRALDSLSMAAYMDAHGWRSARLRWLVEYGCRDDFGTTLGQTSAWAGVHYFAARLGESGQGADFLTWPEGNGRLVAHMARRAGARIKTGAVVTDVRPHERGVDVVWHDAIGGRTFGLHARHAVFALPRFLAAHVIAPYRDAPPPHLAETRYGSWMVANLRLRDHPASRGFPLAWDNVLYDSRALGYVVATHQSGRDFGPTVLTYYMPILDDDPAAGRRRLLATSWNEWVDAIFADLERAHRGLRDLVENVDVYLWGPRHGASASGFPVERRPGRVRAPAGAPAVRAHRPVRDGAVRGGAALGVRAAADILGAEGRPLRPISHERRHRPLVTGVPVATTERGRWLVSARWDVAVFGGSALLAFALLVWGRVSGALAGVTPPWAWIATVLAVDVAHVWSTAYRVYLDPDERRRRPALYLGLPVAAYALGVVLYSASPGLFWRVLAYLAVFHFVRQQYGWVALYRRRLGPSTALDRVLDDAAIYSATLYPLLWWHAHLPREFEWFIEGDFIPGLPLTAAARLLPVHLFITLCTSRGRCGCARSGGR
jgi:hypothetical protein